MRAFPLVGELQLGRNCRGETPVSKLTIPLLEFPVPDAWRRRTRASR
jgi:hypothetical protein